MALASGLLGRQSANADLDGHAATEYWPEADLTKNEGKVANRKKLESLPCYLSLSASSGKAARELYAKGLAFCLGLPYIPAHTRDYANPSDKPHKGGSQKRQKLSVSHQSQPAVLNQIPAEPPYPYNPTGAASVAGLGFVKGLVKGKSLGDSSYGVPGTTYGVPDSSYGVVESSYATPDLNYGAPEPTYGAPHHTYATPEYTYSSPAPSYTTTPEVSYETPSEYSSPEKDEYGSPSAPAIVQLIKSEKLEEHPEVENGHLHENTVTEEQVCKKTLSMDSMDSMPWNIEQRA